ncbi:unnamed protein product [Symbiodinium natans]|uniref:Uncharacterized protein n=1 Tax=Symbiodinium natans TaxID=878477 RepID=A0A812G9F9_9DINO|nr:unnamed protein product [Symbiodinium natans]
MSGCGKTYAGAAVEAGKILLSVLLHQLDVPNDSDSSLKASCKRSETVKKPATSQAGASKAALVLARCFLGRYRLHMGSSGPRTHRGRGHLTRHLQERQACPNTLLQDATVQNKLSSAYSANAPQGPQNECKGAHEFLPASRPRLDPGYPPTPPKLFQLLSFSSSAVFSVQQKGGTFRNGAAASPATSMLDVLKTPEEELCWEHFSAKIYGRLGRVWGAFQRDSKPLFCPEQHDDLLGACRAERGLGTFDACLADMQRPSLGHPLLVPLQLPAHREMIQTGRTLSGNRTGIALELRLLAVRSGQRSVQAAAVSAPT